MTGTATLAAPATIAAGSWAGIMTVAATDSTLRKVNGNELANTLTGNGAGNYHPSYRTLWSVPI